MCDSHAEIFFFCSSGPKEKKSPVSSKSPSSKARPVKGTKAKEGMKTEPKVFKPERGITQTLFAVCTVEPPLETI